ncbi:MAG: DUF1569 domain-containing protein [Chitinophagales bacterium]
MRSIFNNEDAEAFIERINKLTPTTQQIWGNMTVSQMLAHIQQPIRVALGEFKPKRTIFAMIFGGIAKKQLINEKPFKKGLPTDPSFVISNERNFDDEKNKSIDLIRRINAAGIDGMTKDKHPVFGKMNGEEWNLLMLKHLDHHLRQFGV